MYDTGPREKGTMLQGVFKAETQEEVSIASRPWMSGNELRHRYICMGMSMQELNISTLPRLSPLLVPSN